MNRLLPNWLEAYVEYTKDTESLEFFNRWVGISTIASALQKKVWLNLGRLKVFANMYIVLVADPGVARKTQSISYATSIMRSVPDIKISSDSSTMQALIVNMEEAITYTQFEDQTVLRHSSLSVVSKEFETFFTAGTSRTMAVLTDMFDCELEPWTIRTKSYGVIALPAVFVNILAATTPQSLRSCLSDLAVGGGLTSRILFIFAESKSKRVAFPMWTPELETTKRYLCHDLAQINHMTGYFALTESAYKYWNNYYAEFSTDGNSRIEDNSAFDGWYARKSLHILKVAMCLSAAQSCDMRITIMHLTKAIEYIEEVESRMGGIFISSQLNIVTDEKEELLLKHISSNKEISDTKLLHLVWRDMTEGEFDERIKSLLKKQTIKCTLGNVGGAKQLMYSVGENFLVGSYKE